MNRPVLGLALLSAVLCHLLVVFLGTLLWPWREGRSALSQTVTIVPVVVPPPAPPPPPEPPAAEVPLLRADTSVDTPRKALGSLRLPPPPAPPPPPRAVVENVVPKRPAPPPPVPRPKQVTSPAPAPRVANTPPPVRERPARPGPPPDAPLSRPLSPPSPPPRTPLPTVTQREAGSGGTPPGPVAASTPRAGSGQETSVGKTFDRGDVPVVPGMGSGGGRGGSGQSGDGFGSGNHGTQTGSGRGGTGRGDGEGLGTGSGSSGSGGGSGGSGGGGSGSGGTSARPLGGYQVRPTYPEAARRRGIEGTVLLKMRITEDGRVETVHVERSAGHGDLDQAAMEAVRRWRFEPARQRGEPIAVWVMIPVEFKLR